MTPQTTHFLAKARRMIDGGHRMLGIGLWDDVGRAAYLAAFHAAQALIYERRGKLAKTHRGVRAEFAALTRDDAAFEASLRRFLATGYQLKTAADYETSDEPELSEDEVREALAMATEFVVLVTRALTPPTSNKEHNA